MLSRHQPAVVYTYLKLQYKLCGVCIAVPMYIMGYCKTWTLDSGLERGLDHGLDHALDS